MTIDQNLLRIKSSLPPHVKLVAVSKTKPADDIMQAYQTGHHIFGENKAQELVSKYPSLPGDIEWHFIGHLQTNKVKYIAPFVSMIHSVDSLKLLQEINREAQRNNRIIPCLLQFHIAEEETKFGFTEEEACEILAGDPYKNLKNIQIEGVMGMATFTADRDRVRREFAGLKSVFGRLKANFFRDDDTFREISMGMSDDYTIAVEEGSTIVRIGSSIFGSR